MARVSAEDCLKRIPNHFAVCVLAAGRARELAAGARPLVVCNNKAAVTSLREIAAGHVRFGESLDEAVRAHIGESKRTEAARPQKSGRGGRSPAK
jgi:DNA-directed RNA polymerase subunit omega